jgi:hypothetical protein
MGLTKDGHREVVAKVCVCARMALELCEDLPPEVLHCLEVTEAWTHGDVDSSAVLAAKNELERVKQQYVVLERYVMNSVSDTAECVFDLERFPDALYSAARAHYLHMTRQS